MSLHRLRSSAEERAEKEAKSRRELQAISSVVMAGVASSTDLDAALQSMIQEISARLGWESMAAILYADDGLLYTRASYGYPLHSTVIAFRPGEGIVGRVAATRVGRLTADVRDDPHYLDVVNDTRAEMCQPLVVGGRCLGVLNAESPREGAFDEDDFRLLGMLARQMALVIERARISDLERDALERLKEADRLKDDFVATVSHELRSPLTSIKGYARTIQARDAILTGEERAKFIEVMVSQCDRLGQIVEMLLLATRLEAGRVESKASSFPFYEVLRDAAETSNGEERIQLEVDRGITLEADRFRVHHIVRNLMENACKYSPPQSPVLVRAGISGEDVIVEVLDQGAGIPDDKTEEVFGRFQRLSGSSRSAVPGTGLGLYIARCFARDLGGDLTVERAQEEPWAGAVFTLSFPLVMAASSESAETAHAAG
jgi:K+-sensing histidine kinase KdpD